MTPALLALFLLGPACSASADDRDAEAPALASDEGGQPDAGAPPPGPPPRAEGGPPPDDQDPGRRGRGERGGRSGPPPEAIRACEGKALGDRCAFTGMRGEDLEGVCFKPDDAPAEAPPACKPEGAPEPGRRPPPRGED